MKIKDYLKEQFQDIKGMYTFGGMGGETVSIKGSTVRIPPSVTPKVGISNLRVGMDQLNLWHVHEAMEMVIHVMNWWGTPNILTHNRAIWFKVAGFDKVMVKDESIPHPGDNFHLDYLYCTRKNPVPPEFQSQLAEVLPNVMYDGLKKEVTVRCSDMVSNAIYLGFVEDVVNGFAEPTLDELEGRLANIEIPEWFELPNQAWLYREEIRQQNMDWRGDMKNSGGKYGRGYHQKIGRIPMDMEQDLNIKESLNEATYVFASWKNGVLSWRSKERSGSDPMKKKPSEKEVQNHLKKVFGKDVDVEFKVYEAMNEAKKPVFKEDDMDKAVTFYSDAYPEFSEDSIKRGLNAAWKKHKALDPVTVNYFLSEKRLGGLGFGKEK